jgi:PAS domain S-box-containing protein
VIVTTFDITERKQAEEALRASEEQFRIVFRESLDVIMIIDGDTGQIRKVNPAVKRVLGFDESALLGKHFSVLIPPGARLTQEDFLAELRVHEAVFEALRFFRADGSTCSMDLTATVIPWDKGTAVLATFRDVTEREKRERELESIVAVTTVLRDLPHTGTPRAEILPLILEQPTALLKAEGTALITRYSENGHMVVEVGGGLWAAWTGTRLPSSESICRRVIETGQPCLDNDAYALAGDQFDPPQKLVAMACIPLITQEHIIGALCVGRQSEISREEFHLLTVIGDIIASALQRVEAVELLEKRVAERTAELAAANERLQELDKLKSKFVSEVSHELRTPVTNLGMRVYLMEHDKIEAQEDHLEALKSQVKRLKSLIEGILDLSRLEMATNRVTFASVHLNSVVEPVFSAHLPRAQSVGLELRFEAGPDLPPVWGERNQLAQVVDNLIANAINYTPAGAVQVRTDLDPGNEYICLTVEDTGMGIDPDDMPHLFDRFYRGQRVSQMGISGTGLGLAIIKEIVDMHGGKIEVKSVLNRGSTFRVYLPLAPQQS